jgi:hypothetical protein
VSAGPFHILCPYCLSSFGTIALANQPFQLPERCLHCELDPKNDAPFEMSRVEMDAMATIECASCKQRIPDMAVRCKHCRQRPR